MYEININLFISSFDLEKGRKCVVSLLENTFSFPRLSVDTKHLSIDDALAELFEKYIDMGYGWTITKLVDVSKRGEAFDIIYCCTIPPGTELKGAYYISNNLCVTDPLARKAMAYV